MFICHPQNYSSVAPYVQLRLTHAFVNAEISPNAVVYTMDNFYTDCVYLSQRLHHYVPSRTLRSSSSANLHIPRTNLHFGSR